MTPTPQDIDRNSARLASFRDGRTVDIFAAGLVSEDLTLAGEVLRDAGGLSVPAPKQDDSQGELF